MQPSSSPLGWAPPAPSASCYIPAALREMSGSASPSETTMLDALFCSPQVEIDPDAKVQQLKEQCRERLQKTLPKSLFLN